MSKKSKATTGVSKERGRPWNHKMNREKEINKKDLEGIGY